MQVCLSDDADVANAGVSYLGPTNWCDTVISVLSSFIVAATNTHNLTGPSLLLHQFTIAAVYVITSIRIS